MAKVKHSVMLMLLVVCVLSLTLPARGEFIWTSLEDFEGYSDTADLNANGPLHLWSAYGGAAAYSLATETSSSGDQSMRCYLDPAGYGTSNLYGIRFGKESAVDLISYDVLSISIRGDSSVAHNQNVTSLKLRIADEFGNVIIDQALDLALATSDDWHNIEIAIDSEDWRWSGIDWVSLYVGRTQYYKPEFYIDDLKVGVVPEPASMAIFGLGASLIGLGRRKKHTQRQTIN